MGEHGRSVLLFADTSCLFSGMGREDSNSFRRVMEEVQRIWGGNPGIIDLACERPAEDFFPESVTRLLLFTMNVAYATMIENELEEIAFKQKNTLIDAAVDPLAAAFAADCITLADAIRIFDAVPWRCGEKNNVAKVLESIDIKTPRFSLVREGKNISTADEVREMLHHPIPPPVFSWKGKTGWFRHQRRIKEFVWCGPGNPPEGVVRRHWLLPLFFALIGGSLVFIVTAATLRAKRRRARDEGA